MFAPRLVIQDDLDGWTVTFRGGGFNPILLFIGSVHFLLGSTFTLGALTTLVGSIGSGELFLALFALGYGMTAWGLLAERYRLPAAPEAPARRRALPHAAHRLAASDPA